MHLAHPALRSLTVLTLIAAAALACSSSTVTASDRTPLVGSAPRQLDRGTTVTPTGALIVPIPAETVPCLALVNFDDVKGGSSPGTNYDGVLISGGLLFAERFAGQSTGAFGDFDAISGAPTNPLTLAVGAPFQNLDVFDYAGNVLAGLGPVGYDDIDAIGEGAMAVYFPYPQSKVKLDLVGGNGGTATLSFFRPDGSLIEDVYIAGLADLSYGFATFDGSSIIGGILVQNTDASGIGIDNICHDPGVVPVRPFTWGGLKQLYR